MSADARGVAPAPPAPSDAALEAAHTAHDDVQRDPADPEAIYTVTTAGLRAALTAAYAIDFAVVLSALAAARARATEMEDALKPFGAVPTHGDYGGPLVQATPRYEDGSKGKILAHEAFAAARRALASASPDPEMNP